MDSLQSGVSKTQFIPFDEVQSQQGYQAAPDEAKAQIALEYFDKTIATQEGYKKAQADGQGDAIRSEFFQRYNVPDIKPAHKNARFGDFQVGGPAGQALQAVNTGLGTFNALTGSVTAPFNDAYTWNLNPDNSGLILDDPNIPDWAKGVYQNKWLNAVGSGLGSVAGGSLLGSGIKKAIPNISKPLLGAGVAGLYSAGTNLVNTLRGKQDWIEGATQVPLDTLTGLVGGNGWKGAILEGLGEGTAGGVGSVLSDKFHGRAVDWSKAGDQALTQAAVGFGLGKGMDIASRPSQVVTDPNGGVTLKGKVEATQEQPEPSVSVENQQALDPAQQKALRRQIVQDLHGMLTSQDAEERVAGQQKLKEFESLAKDKTRPSGSLRKAGDPNAKAILAELEIYKEQVKAKEAQAQADNKALSKAEQNRQKREQQILKGEIHKRASEEKTEAAQKSKEEKARLRELETEQAQSRKRREQLEKEATKQQTIKEKQAIKDQIALEKAESQRRKLEMQKLKSEMTAKKSIEDPAEIDKHADTYISMVKKGKKNQANRALRRNFDEDTLDRIRDRVAEKTKKKPTGKKNNEQKTQTKQQDRPEQQPQKGEEPTKQKPPEQPKEKPRQDKEVAIEPQPQEGHTSATKILEERAQAKEDARAELARLKEQQKATTEKREVGKLQTQINKLEAYINRGISPKAKQTLKTLEQAADQGMQVRITNIPDPSRPKSAPIAGDQGLRTIRSFNLNKDGSISVRTYTGDDTQPFRTYNADSIDKVEITDKPAERLQTLAEKNSTPLEYAQADESKPKSQKAAKGLIKASKNSKPVHDSLTKEAVTPKDLKDMSLDSLKPAQRKVIDEASNC